MYCFVTSINYVSVLKKLHQRKKCSSNYSKRSNRPLLNLIVRDMCICVFVYLCIRVCVYIYLYICICVYIVCIFIVLAHEKLIIGISNLTLHLIVFTLLYVVSLLFRSTVDYCDCYGICKTRKSWK